MRERAVEKGQFEMQKVDLGRISRKPENAQLTTAPILPNLQLVQHSDLRIAFVYRECVCVGCIILAQQYKILWLVCALLPTPGRYRGMAVNFEIRSRICLSSSKLETCS